MHRQHFSEFFRSVIGTFRARRPTLNGNETRWVESSMEAIGRIYIPLIRRSKWPRVNLTALFRPFRQALELYAGATSAVYVTALLLDQREERIPCEDLEGRDPRW